MLGSISADFLPNDDSGTRGTPARATATIGAATTPHEPAAVSPLLRDAGAGLVADALDGPDDLAAPDHLDTADADAVGLHVEPAPPTVDKVAAQLAPIQSRDALAASFAREANPDDPILRAGYVCAWAELGMRLTLGATRRARHRATLAGPRRRPAGGRA